MIVLALFAVAVFSLGILVGSRIPREVQRDTRRFVPVPEDVAWRDVRLDTIESVLRSGHG